MLSFYQSVFTFCRAMLCISATYAVVLCLSVCVSVTFVNCVKTNKHIFKIFPPPALGSQVILVFQLQTAWQYSDGNPPNGALNADGVGRNRDSEPISGLTACC